MTPISIHWDYYDQVYEFDGPYGLPEMRRLCRDAKEAGVKSLNFRVEGAGMAWVPNPVRPMFERYDPAARLSWSNYDRLPALSNDPSARRRVAELFQQTYTSCPDPLAAAVEAAAEADLQLNVYVCPYDQYWPGVPGTYVEQHPEHCIASRDGKTRLSVPSLAYPGFREWLLCFYDAVLEHDIADVIVYSGSHAWYAYPTDTPDDWFGFEEPAVEDYRAKTGVDVRTQPFDIDDYYRHYGTYWTALLRELATRQAERNRRLIVGMDLGPWQVYLPWNAGRLMTTWRHFNDWQTWTGWGNVDLCVGHQVNMWEYDQWPGNRLSYMPGEPDRPPYCFARDLFGESAKRDFQLWSFLTLHKNRADLELPLAFDGTHTEGFDGLMIREAADFEFDLGWDSLKRFMC